MEVSIRKAVAEDARQIRDVHLASIEGLGSQGYTEEQVAVWAHDRDPEEYPIESQDTYFLVAENNTAVIGFGWMKSDAGDHFETDVEGEITAIYIHPSVARQGIGSRIYAELEAQAVRQNIDSLGLWASRNAVPFYEAQGYNRVTDHAHEYHDEITLLLVEMEKQAIR
ncbi:GNAT family N-acetyltransferase [Saliphagus sp. LR7]|uniref:GNAT family N-acetyltransferase n=1 Tax=Saliphagus sp. LR7 TaxID=2282654 RepID=UPI000DF84429|nr:GNAT family N-acetyltransferase [Saliphagus sp. LR7]